MSREWALRVALLHDTLIQSAQEKAAAAAKSHARAQSNASLSNISSPQSSSQPSSSALGIDFGALLKRDAKSPRYPERMIKGLDGLLQRVAMGKETKYSDARFRRTIALFWSSNWPEKSFQRQLKEDRRVEDLILSFTSVSAKSLKKEEGLGDSGWKEELNVQVSLFIDMIKDALSAISISWSSSEPLRQRLEQYQTSLRSAPKDNGDLSRSKSNKSVANSIGDRSSVAAVPETPKYTEGELTKVVEVLYNWPKDELDQKSDELRQTCTPQAAVNDFKTILKLLNTEKSYPYNASDFLTQAKWQAWRGQEVSTLSQVMLLMMQADSSSPDQSSTSSIASQFENLNLDTFTPSFTFIPPNARETYQQILENCLNADLDALEARPDDEEVPLTILSENHTLLLKECAERWRLTPEFCSWAFMDAMIGLYEAGDVPVDCVLEATSMINKMQVDKPSSEWAAPELEGLSKAINRRDGCFLSSLITTVTQAGYLSEDFISAVNNWTTVSSSGNQLPQAKQTLEHLLSLVKSQASDRYIDEAVDKIRHEGSKTYGFIMQMAAWVEKETKRSCKKFTESLSPDIDLVEYILDTHWNLWLHDLKDTLDLVPSEARLEALDDDFMLFNKATKLDEMRHAMSGGYGGHPVAPADPPISSLFHNTVNLWLDSVGTKTRGWVDSALMADNFESTVENGPSSSVGDLFDSLTSAAEFLMDLNWPDEHQLAEYVTRLSRVIGTCINDYCATLEQYFNIAMRAVETSQTEEKQKVWMEKAKATLASMQGEKKIQAFFNFTPESCVKLNNIESARHRLDRLYTLLRVDELSKLTSPVVPANRTQRYLFTVKIVLAEGVVFDNGSGARQPDSFVILSDEHGKRHHKTRTVYDDSNPRWDESCDVIVNGTAWFMITARHRNLTGKHDLLGRAYLQLNPADFENEVLKDILQPLDTRGVVLLRISMESERDDMEFHFGKAFRCLKRTESDMVRLFVDRMTPVLRHTLSRAGIKSVLKSNNPQPQVYNEALGKISAVYKSAIGTPDYNIPAPHDHTRGRGPSDEDIESAIHPLFDYLDTNIHTLASTLSSNAMQMVMTKLWKQILMTIEGLIVPPLSDKPSSMRPLRDAELDITLRWLKFLKDFFYVGGDSSGVPISILQSPKFNEILSVRIYYDWATDDLMEECVRGFQSTLQYRATKRMKSVKAQRNLGTIKARKTAKRKQNKDGGNAEMIMRILRMRPGTQEFLAQQLQAMSIVKLRNSKEIK
ncbi:hypothetical protein B9479_001030 [Cryptococcus floricola]|uniref:C2 domain-containing protein n=1 Tax=Cryptococcus floricola TaxID=2591691 RepID=A0A5D3B7B5_9TREE|nr:hypothetical protein B9479_001030 [Cryptococcus floricola]